MNTSEAESSHCTSIPIREGLLSLDPPTLLGSRCSRCETLTFPARRFCPACRSESVESNIALSRHGTIYSFTVVRQAPPGRRVPYCLAYVDLDDGVRVMAQVDADLESLRIGMCVTLSLRVVDHKDDQARIGYAFVPAVEMKEGQR